MNRVRTVRRSAYRAGAVLAVGLLVSAPLWADDTAIGGSGGQCPSNYNNGKYVSCQVPDNKCKLGNNQAKCQDTANKTECDCL